ncbi:MAG: 4Fe-4S dicluster domain-containing protein [Alphaproteobacteria bacterium]|uniref:4Fe-4S dicluster domain-containing protein n=1 Tax=Candidatus Nitrobium versatile TaxID=2884831 RepID=A0A953J8Q3_9BACT|nr:4Fe-4S dicluster domain-containing protein [Candidatus Nitrobium versatile]
MSQYTMMVDLERCIGCKSCEAACKLENGIPMGRYRTKVIWVAPQKGSRLYFVSMPCMHCAKPACKASCPVGAISKRQEDGVVLIDKERCIGCRYCAWACPYGAMGFDEDRMVADKCTYCAHRLARGEQPSCVTKCPGRALTFGRAEELFAKARSEGRWCKDIDTFGTGPSTSYLERLKK